MRISHVVQQPIHLGTELDDAPDNAAADVGEEDGEDGEIGIGAKSGQRAVPKFVIS